MIRRVKIIFIIPNKVKSRCFVNGKRKICLENNNKIYIKVHYTTLNNAIEL